MADGSAGNDNKDTREWRNQKWLPPAVAIVADLLVGVVAIFEGTQNAIEKALKLPRYALVVLCGLLLIPCLGWLISKLQQVSRLTHKKDFLHRIAGHEMFGRAEERKVLIELCQHESLVFLVGESGVGKSTLLREGLAKSSDVEAIVLYMDMRNTDFDLGLKEGLQRAVETHTKLNKGEKERLLSMLCPWRPSNAGAGPEPEPTPEPQSKRLVLILDQFDEYQTRHRKRFLEKKMGTWISAGTLCKKNEFWAHLRKLIQNPTVTCVIAARTDTAREPVHLVDEPKVYPLSRLRRDGIEVVVDGLSIDGQKKSLIDDPEKGWKQLREELIDDLQDSNAGALPVRIKQALRGLAYLPNLSVNEYRRGERLSGLETAHLSHLVSTISTTYRLNQDRMYDLLLLLAGCDEQPIRSHSLQELAQSITDPDRSRDRKAWEKIVRDILGTLETEKIVRKRLDSDSSDDQDKGSGRGGGKTVGEQFTLTHEFWAESIRNAKVSREAPVQNLLRRKKEFERAQGYWSRWWMLLSIRELAAYCRLGVKGKLKRVSLGRYAAWSVGRLVVHVTLVVGVCVGSFTGMKFSMVGHFAERWHTPYFPDMLLDGPSWLKWMILKELGNIPQNYLGARWQTLIVSYLDSVNDVERQQAIEKLVIPLALMDRTCKLPNNKCKADFALESSRAKENKAKTAALLAEYFMDFQQNTQKNILSYLAEDEWRKMVSRELPRIGNKYDSKDLDHSQETQFRIQVAAMLEGEDPSVKKRRAGFLVETWANRPRESAPPDAVQLRLTMSLISLLGEKKDSLSNPQWKLLAGEIISELPACRVKDCREAVGILLQRKSFIDPEEQQILGVQILKMVNEGDITAARRLSQLCLGGWSPMEDAEGLRRKFAKQLTFERIDHANQAIWVTAWSCLFSSASPSDIQAAAERVSRWLPQTHPYYLSSLMYAFWKLNKGLDKEERRKAYGLIIHRFLGHETLMLAYNPVMASFLGNALDRELPEDRAQIVQKLLNELILFVQNDPTPREIPFTLKEFVPIIRKGMALADPQWTRLIDAIFDRHEKGWTKDWIRNAYSKLPEELRRPHVKRFQEAILRALHYERSCRDLVDSVGFLAPACDHIEIDGCARILRTLGESMAEGGACDVEDPYQIPSNKLHKQKLIAGLSTDQQRSTLKDWLDMSCHRSPGNTNQETKKNILKELCTTAGTDACRAIRNEVLQIPCSEGVNIDDLLPSPP